VPIARINRAAEKEATPEIDETYIPPLLACDAWPALQLGIVREIYDLIGKKIEVISNQVTNRGIGFESREPGDLDRLFMLAQLNAAYCVLRVLTYARGVHPFGAYTELCRIVGQLSIFSDQRRAPKIPRYDHDDLGDIFRKIKLQIEILLQAVAPYRFEQRFFVGRGARMEVALEPKWLNSDWRWHVGVQFEGLKPSECRELLSTCHWKLASSRQVDDIFKYGGEGISLMALERAPTPLPEDRHWIFYDVDRQTLVFQDVLETQTLAMRLTEERIVNRDDLQGRELMILSHGNRQVKLKVALFAVPVRT
jgi:type VI secretion system protein ImpJ